MLPKVLPAMEPQLVALLNSTLPQVLPGLLPALLPALAPHLLPLLNATLPALLPSILPQLLPQVINDSPQIITRIIQDLPEILANVSASAGNSSAALPNSPAPPGSAQLPPIQNVINGIISALPTGRRLQQLSDLPDPASLPLPTVHLPPVSLPDPASIKLPPFPALPPLDLPPSGSLSMPGLASPAELPALPAATLPAHLPPLPPIQDVLNDIEHAVSSATGRRLLQQQDVADLPLLNGLLRSLGNGQVGTLLPVHAAARHSGGTHHRLHAGNAHDDRSGAAHSRQSAASVLPGHGRGGGEAAEGSACNLSSSGTESADARLLCRSPHSATDGKWGLSTTKRGCQSSSCPMCSMCTQMRQHWHELFFRTHRMTSTAA